MSPSAATTAQPWLIPKESCLPRSSTVHNVALLRTVPVEDVTSWQRCVRKKTWPYRFFFVRNPASRLLIVLNCLNDLNGLNPLPFCSHAIYAIFYRW